MSAFPLLTCNTFHVVILFLFIYVFFVALGLCCCMDFVQWWCTGFSLPWPLFLRSSTDCQRAGFSSCSTCIQRTGSMVVVHRLSCSCIEPVSPALVSGFFTTEPLGKTIPYHINDQFSFLRHLLLGWYKFLPTSFSDIYYQAENRESIHFVSALHRISMMSVTSRIFRIS